MEGNPTYEELTRKVKKLEQKISEHKRREDVYRSIVESTSDSIYIVDKDCKYLFMNSHHLSRLGLRMEQIFGKPYRDFHSPDKDKDFTNAVGKVYSTGASIQQEHKSQRDNRYFLRTFSPVKEHSPHGKIISVVVVSKDITEHKIAEESIRESEKKYRTIIENIEDGYQELDFPGNIIFFNDALLKMLGYSRDEFLGMNYRDLTSEETALQMLQIFNEVYETGNPRRGIEIEIIKRDGSVRDVEVSVSLLLDAKGEGTGFRNLIRDVTERKRSEETIRRLAYHDSLTGLPNRLLFIDRLNMAIARVRRNRQYLAVMMLDLDNFKDINDSLGHYIGDQLLQSVGNRIAGLLRKGDTVARMGGDEFMLLLSEIQKLEDTTTIAQKIIETFQMPFFIDDRELRITTSIGIAIYPDGSEDVDTLIKHADIAMYRAKASGRNNYKLFTQDIIKTST